MGAFWSTDGSKPEDAGVDELKKHLAASYDFTTNVVAVFKERFAFNLIFKTFFFDCIIILLELLKFLHFK
jgi:hypothetical protein